MCAGNNRNFRLMWELDDFRIAFNTLGALKCPNSEGTKKFRKEFEMFN